MFAVKLTSPRYGTRIDPDTGLITVPRMDLVAVPPEEWDAALDGSFPDFATAPGPDADPRAFGLVTEVWAEGEEVPIFGGGAWIVRRSTRVENDGGAWVGTATVRSMGAGGAHMEWRPGNWSAKAATRA